MAIMLAALTGWPAREAPPPIRRAPGPQTGESPPVGALGPFAPPLPDGPFERTSRLPGMEREQIKTQIKSARPMPPSAAPPKAPAIARPPIAAPRQSGGAASPQAWMRHAAAAPVNPHHLPLIAIVIDDLGAAAARVDEALALPAPITLAVLPYARDAARIASAARARGHEVLVHLPMEAENAHSPGPQALSSALTPEAFAERLEWNLTRFSGYAGVNNHMGSRLTQNRAAMAMLMAQLKQRGLLFLDSRTAANTIAATTARLHGLTTLERDIFLDNEITPEMIRAQLDKTEATARRNGYAIAIGHPHSVTVAALQQWAADLEARGFMLAPLSAIARLQTRGPQLVALPPPGG